MHEARNASSQASQHLLGRVVDSHDILILVHINAAHALVAGGAWRPERWKRQIGQRSCSGTVARPPQLQASLPVDAAPVCLLKLHARPLLPVE